MTPILVAGTGRSGTTAVMAQLGVEPRIAFDRVYPYENRYLTYWAKCALLAERPGGLSAFTSDQLCNFKNSEFGARPWPTTTPADGDALALSTSESLAALWHGFVEGVRRRRPGATHVAEKAPAWLPATLRRVTPVRTIYLVRDPRDVFLSANAFNRARGFLAFGRDESDTDREYALKLAYAWLQYFENQRVDQDDAMTIRFEDFMQDRAASVRRIGEFLSLDLRPDESAGSEHLPIHQTSSSLEQTVGRWRREPLDSSAAALLEAMLHEAMAFNGYPLSGSSRPVAELPLTEFQTSSPDGACSLTDRGHLQAEIRGADFWIETPAEGLSTRPIAEIWTCLRGNVGEHCSLYWRRPGEIFDQGRSVHSPFCPGDHWQIIRFVPAGHEHWHGRLAGIRLDLCNNPARAGRAEIRWIRLIPAD